MGKMLKVNATLRTLRLDSLKLMYHENREREREREKQRKKLLVANRQQDRELWG